MILWLLTGFHLEVSEAEGEYVSDPSKYKKKKSIYQRGKRDFLGHPGPASKPSTLQHPTATDSPLSHSPLVASLFFPRKREKREKEEAREDLRE